jgi:DNA-binding NtrC family response regulator
MKLPDIGLDTAKIFTSREYIKLKILIVDDDRNLLSVLKTILAEENNDVATSSDGGAAIDLIRKIKFDLVITDLMMPGTNGLEVLREARKIDPDILVILITGFASLETAVQAIREGAYDYITKPFKLDEIKIIVNNAREKILLTRENKNLIMELQEAYKQLQIIKNSINANSLREEINGEEPDTGPAEKEVYISGSMLPLYYTENMQDLNQPVLSHLERAAALRERGLLTEEEFSLCKSKLFRNIKQ